MDLFTEETTAAIVVGRPGSGTVEAIKEAGSLLEELGEKAGVTFEIVVHADFATDEPDDDQETEFVVGVLIAEAETDGPAAFELDAIDAALGPLSELTEADWGALDAAGLELSDEDEDRAPLAWLVCLGPLANGWVAYGHSDETGDLEEIRGQGMDQEEQESAVWGILALTTSYEESPCALDLSPKAREQHRGELGEHGEGAQYFLIASYD